MRTNLFYIVLLAYLLTICSSNVFGQDLPKKNISVPAKKPAIVDSKNKNETSKTAEKTTVININDSLKQKNGVLGSKVKYKAKKSAKYEQKKRILTLYDQAELFYEDYELKAGIIVFNAAKSEVYAGRLKDSAGNYIQLPYFKQGNNIVEPDSIRFNFKTKKALVWNSRTTQQELKIKAEISKKDSDSVYYMKGARITTAEDIDDPEYYFYTTKAKFVPGKKVVVGPTNMVIAGVPTPLMLPFAFFPITTKSQSGILLPSYGQTAQRGYSLQNLGYYFAFSDKLDMEFGGDYYTNGSYGLRAKSNYSQKYKYNGSVNLSFDNLIESERGFPDYSKSKNYNFQWSHTKDQKSNPNSSFSASVNLGSSNFFRQNVYVQNSGSALNNTFNSSVSYRKTLQTIPQVNFNLTANHSQNTNTRLVNLTLPTLNATVDRIFPFALGDGLKKGFFKNINFQYSLDARNSIETTEDDFLTSKMFSNMKTGFKNSIPISTNYKVFKYFSATSTVNYDEIWTLQTVKKKYDFTTNTAKDEIVKGFDGYRTFSFSQGLSTTIYGTFNFKGKLKSIRHKMSPNISYSYVPGNDKYYTKYETSNTSNVLTDPIYQSYSRFDNTVFGAPGIGISNGLSFSLVNDFEAKVVDKDSTKTELKKIKLLNNLTFNSAYDLVQAKWSTISMTGGTLLFKDKMNLNFGAQFNPYATFDPITNEKFTNPFAMSSANLTMSYNLASSKSEKKKKNNQGEKNGGRNDDLFGNNSDLADFSRDQAEDSEQKEEEFQGFYNYEIPWDINLAYSLTYSNQLGKSEITNNSIMFSVNTDLTPKWKIGLTSSYDFARNGIGQTQMRFQRDLKSWNMNVSWSPFGQNAYWGFFIGIKASILKDIKYDKQTRPDRILR